MAPPPPRGRAGQARAEQESNPRRRRRPSRAGPSASPSPLLVAASLLLLLLALAASSAPLALAATTTATTDCAKLTGVRGCSLCPPAAAAKNGTAAAATAAACTACDAAQGYVLSPSRGGRCDALPGFGSSVDLAFVESALTDGAVGAEKRAAAERLIDKYKADFPGGGALRRCPDADGFATYVRGPGPARPRFAVCTPCPQGLAADAAKAACVRDPARGPAPVADAPLPPLPPPPGSVPPPAPPALAQAGLPPGVVMLPPLTPGALVAAAPSGQQQAGQPPQWSPGKNATAMAPMAPGGGAPGAAPMAALPVPKPGPAPFCYEAFWKPTPAVACNYREPLPGTTRCNNATTGCTVASCCVLTCGRDFHDSIALNAEPDQAGAARKRRAKCASTPVGGHPAPDTNACPATGCTPDKCCDKADVRCWAAFDKSGGPDKYCPASRKPRPGDTKCPPGGCTQDLCCDKAPTCEGWFKLQQRPGTPCDVYLPKDKATLCPGASGLCDRNACCDLTLQQCSLVKSSWWRPSFACPKNTYLDGAARCREPCPDSALTSSCCRAGAAPPAAPKPAPPPPPQGSFFG